MKKILMAFTAALALTAITLPTTAYADSSKSAAAVLAEYDTYWIFQYWNPVEQLCYYRKRTVLGVQWKTYKPPVGICPQTLLY